MLTIHSALAERSRLVDLAPDRDAVRPWEVAVLVGCGLLASAAVIFMDFSLRIPGHAILRAVVPMSFGLAMVPRKGAGLLMSGAALVGVLGAGFGGYGAGAGATTSLLCTGPLLDIASRQASRGWRLCAAFGVAGLLSNVLAFIVRAATRVGGGSGGTGGGARAGWWATAPLTYAACGLLAGVVCALVWFQWRSEKPGFATDGVDDA